MSTLVRNLGLIRGVSPVRRAPIRALFGSRITAGGPVLPVTFPTTRLVSRVRVALGADLSADPLTWAWQDITDKVRFDLGISLTTGRRDEATQATTGSAMLKLDNRVGWFTRRNPKSPYYGLLSGNTPIWATVDAGSGEKTRLEMFVNEWPTRWSDKAATDSTVTIRCAGVLRRLGQGRALKSALRRSLERNANILTYWPLEDGANATSAASGILGGTAMTVAGSPAFSAASGPGGSAPLLDLSNGGILRGIGTVPASSTDAMRLQLLLKFTSGGSASASTPIVDWTTAGGTYRLWRLSINASNQLQVDYQSSTSGSDSLTSILSGGFYDDEWHRIEIGQRSHETTGDLITYLHVDSASHSVGPHITLGVGETFGYIDQLTINPTDDSGGHLPAIGHIVVNIQDGFAEPDPFSPDPGLDGYTGEMAHVRMARLCSEEGVQFECLASTSATMGAQGTDSLLGLLRECEAADGGSLFEKRWGLAYQALSQRYNQPVGLALDFHGSDVSDLPEPADDDQRTRNLWTVSRTDGSEATVEETTGAMGTGSGGPGVYDDSATLNVETDGQLPQQAGWRVHLGTVDEDRWPNIGLNFTRTPDLIDAWTALSYGARITVANPPTQMPPDDLDLIIEGHSERWDPIIWIASLNCSPDSAYRVVVVGSTSGNLGRVDAANSTLAADVTSVDTSLSVASTGALWRTGSVNFDLNVAGERMTVTNISGGSSPQTFTVSRSVNGVVKAQYTSVGGIATKVSLWKPGVYAL